MSSQDISEIIEQLKPVVGGSNFTQLLDTLTPDFSKPQRFLLKMEVMRLAKACTRIIDQRDKTSITTQVYQHDAITHYLTDKSIAVFEHQVRIFGDYTIGVYEAVESHLSQERISNQQGLKIQSEATEEPVPYNRFKAPIVVFDDFIQRCEERMNFSIELELVTESDNDIPAISLDISLNGLRLKVAKDYQFFTGRKLFIVFKGLEKEFALGVKGGVLYSIIDIEEHNDYQRLSLERINNGDSVPFDNFLSQFINGNKRRYKVNVDNTIHALRVKGYEQYYIPYFTSVPLFIDCVDGNYEPRYILTNNNNRDLLSFWHDEDRWLKIEGLLSKKRLARYISNANSAVSTFLYCFSFNHKGKTYFYSASKEELLDDPQLMSTYMGYGSRRVSWRVYAMQIVPVDASTAHKPLSLPDSISQQVLKQNAPPVPRLVKKLNTISHVCLLTDVTSQHNTDCYQHIKVGRDSVVDIQTFLHPRVPEHEPLTLYRFKYHELRLEERFNYRSDIVLNVDGENVSATTEDISITGLRVQLNESYDIHKRSIIKVSLPNLQQYTKKVTLIDLPYKVMEVSQDGNVVHLRGFTDFEEEDVKPMSTSRRFFSAFIKQFKNELVSIAEPDDIPGMGEALRNIYSSHNLNLAVFFKRDNIYIHPVACGKTSHNDRLLRLFSTTDEHGQLDLSPMYLDGQQSNDVISNTIKELQTSNTPVTVEAFIQIPNDRTRNTRCIYGQQFKDNSARSAFIKNAQKEGKFVAIRLFLSKTGKADIDILQTELKYVSVYASHRASELEKELWSVAAIADILDITEEVALRYDIK